MRRYFKLMLFTMLAVAMLASTAMAGTTTVNHRNTNNPVTVSAQALGAANNLLLNGTNAVPAVKYALGQTLSTGNLIQVSFDSGLAFTGAQINVCAQNGGAANNVEIATATPSANTTSFNFQVGNVSGVSVAAGNNIWLTNAACHGTTNPDAANFPVRVLANQTTGNRNITIGVVTPVGISVDPASSAVLAKIEDEYEVTLTTADTITIDYVGTPGDGTEFTTGKVAGSANKISITRTAKDYSATNGAQTTNTVGNAAATANLAITLTDTQDWQGVSRISAENVTVACPATAGAINVTPPSSGAATLNYTTFNGNASANVSVCVYVAGNTPLQTRTISGKYQIKFDNKGVSMPESTTAEYQKWVLNAYQGLVPWLVKSDGLKTYCLINNNSTQNAPVTLTVFSSESAANPTNISLGNLASGKSQLYVFGEKVVAGSNEYDLTGLTNGDRYAAYFTVAANGNSVSATCNQYDPAGAKRIVPVLTDKDGSKWKN